MAKDPAFLFYPGDYLRDTQTLSEKSQVSYDRIMCEHMRNICISKQQLKFFTKKLNEDELEELMFVLTEVKGGFQIEWVAESIDKRKAYSESRRKNRVKKNKKDMLTYDKHMENEIENEIVIKDELNKGVLDFSNLPKEEKQVHWDNFRTSKEKLLSSTNVFQWSTSLKLKDYQVTKAIEDYFNDCFNREDIYRNFLDYKSHCFNWMKKNKAIYLIVQKPE